MTIRRVPAIALLLVALTASACGGDDTGSAATTATTLTVPTTAPPTTGMSTTAPASAVPTTAPPTTAPPTTAPPTTVGPPPSTVVGGFVQYSVSVGQPIAFETTKPPNFFEGSPNTNVWLVPDGAASRNVELVPAGLLALGRVRGDALVVDGVVPRTLGTPVNNGAATFRAVTPGRYRVEAAGAQVAWLLVEGTGDDALPVGRALAVNPAQAVLADDGLAGVAFGTAEDDAHRRLVERFGPPTADTGWVDVCVPHREVRWGGLVARYGWSDQSRVPHAGSRVFLAYEYAAGGDGPQGLTSTGGIALGATLHDVLAAPGPWSITNRGYDPALVHAWRGALGDAALVPFAVRFDRDVTAAGPRPVVVAMASARALHPFASC